MQLLGDSEAASRRTSRAPTRVPSPVLSLHEEEGGLLGATDPTPEIAGLIPDVTAEPQQKITVSLGTRVNAGGSNFSQGQRQVWDLHCLFCATLIL